MDGVITDTARAHAACWAQTFDEYLEERPTAADILVRRGYLRIENGDTKGAEADFRSALKFLPNDPAALDGLKQIGVEE
jgi:beta-phosphoglucomutase-like phosphatase (HAD superfamily)